MTTSASPTVTTTHPDDETDHHDADNRFAYDVDGATYSHDRPKITGAAIMAAATVPLGEGLVQLLPDGTTRTVAPDDEIDLAPGAQFKRRPRFKRG